MDNLVPDEQVRAHEEGQAWSSKLHDKLLDFFFQGTGPRETARLLGRSPKAVKRQIEDFRCNYRDKTIHYRPIRRISRKGKRITQNELMMIRSLRKRGISAQIIARLLQRDIHEIEPDYEGKARIQEMKEFAPSLDLILACRYAFHHYHIRPVTDKTYDDMVAEEIEYGGVKIEEIKIDRYPDRIKSLALYLTQKQSSSFR